MVDSESYLSIASSFAMYEPTEDLQNIHVNAVEPETVPPTLAQSGSLHNQVVPEPTSSVLSCQQSRQLLFQGALLRVRRWHPLVSLWIIPILVSYLVVAIPAALWQTFEHPYQEDIYRSWPMLQYYLWKFLSFFFVAPNIVLISTLPFLVLVSLVPVKSRQSGNAYLTYNLLAIACVNLYHSTTTWMACGGHVSFLHIILSSANFWCVLVPIVPAMLVRALLLPKTQKDDDEVPKLTTKD